MGRGPTSQKKKEEAALALALKVFGDAVVAAAPVETHEDLMMQAQAVINYFEVKGDGFYSTPCANCELPFAYAYHIKAVKCCSIPCMKEHLKNHLGLDWDPHRPTERRWGRYVPAIVPPQALDLVDSLLRLQEEKQLTLF